MMRTALVTGGMSGLGAAAATRLADDGFEVVRVDVVAGADHCADVSDPVAVDRLASDLGAVDVVVNSAGVLGPNRPLWEVDPNAWNETFAINVGGTFNVCRAFVPGMRANGWGRVINLASIAGKEGNPNLSAYSASKAAVIGLTKALGKELAMTGVLVHAIAPAVIATPMNDATDPIVLERLISLIPMRRVGQPGEVAELIAWLASDRCTFTTGAVHDISGGRATY